jgi:hypothetical protein
MFLSKWLAPFGTDLWMAVDETWKIVSRRTEAGQGSIRNWILTMQPGFSTGERRGGRFTSRSRGFLEVRAFSGSTALNASPETEVRKKVKMEKYVL